MHTAKFLKVIDSNKLFRLSRFYHGYNNVLLVREFTNKYGYILKIYGANLEGKIISKKSLPLTMKGDYLPAEVLASIGYSLIVDKPAPLVKDIPNKLKDKILKPYVLTISEIKDIKLLLNNASHNMISIEDYENNKKRLEYLMDRAEEEENTYQEYLKILPHIKF